MAVDLNHHTTGYESRSEKPLRLVFLGAATRFAGTFVKGAMAGADGFARRMHEQKRKDPVDQQRKARP